MTFRNIPPPTATKDKQTRKHFLCGSRSLNPIGADSRRLSNSSVATCRSDARCKRRSRPVRRCSFVFGHVTGAFRGEVRVLVGAIGVSRESWSISSREAVSWLFALGAGLWSWSWCYRRMFYGRLSHYRYYSYGDLLRWERRIWSGDAWQRRFNGRFAGFVRC